MSSPYIQNVPPPFRLALTRLVNLSDEAFSALLTTLEASQAATDRQLANEIALAPAGLEAGEAQQLVTAVASLLAAAADVGVPDAAMARPIADASSLDLDEADRDRLAERIGNVLEKDVVYTLGKARRLRQSHERSVEDVELLTDLRPVYSRAEPLEIHSMLVWHTLRIKYEEAEESRVIEFALERTSLERLKERVQRALDKDQAAVDRLDVAEIRIASRRNGDGEQPND